jgi:hypothetical protein
VLKAEAERRGWRADDKDRARDLDIPDVRWSGYGPRELGSFFDLIGPKGRALYLRTQASLDLVFPFIYGLFFATTLVSLYPWKWRWVVFLPLAAALFDLAENFSNIYLASVFVENQPARDFAIIASVFTTTKCAALLACAAAILFGLVAKIFPGLSPWSDS